MMSLRNVEDLKDDNPNEPFWKQNDACSGFRTSDDCPFRASEMELISYQPYECQAQNQIIDKPKNCDQLFAYARYNVAQSSQARA